MERAKVVIQYVAGNLIKGFTQDFFPNRETFHVFPVDESPSSSIEVSMKDLKAIFLVRDFLGNPQYNEQKRFNETDGPSRKKLEVVFMDGEVITGSALAYDRNRPGFFIVPADPKSNNMRVFVVSSAIKNVRQL
jgi:hypothetical protein